MCFFPITKLNQMAQVIIEMGEYNRIIEMSKEFEEKKIYISHDSYFSGGPGGITKHGIVVYGLDEKPEEILNYEKARQKLQEEYIRREKANDEYQKNLNKNKGWF